MARTYRQTKRGLAADDMRRRIVEAMFDLHGEQGIAATTMKQIAERAGVSVGSVYHHFATYDQAVLACGAYAFEINPAPTEAIFAGAPSRRERVRRLAEAMFRLFAGLRAFPSVLKDQEKMPVLKPFAQEEAQIRTRLAQLALGEAPAELTTTLAALVDVGVHEAMTRAGFSTEAAAARIAEVANAWLDTQSPEQPKEA